MEDSDTRAIRRGWRRRLPLYAGALAAVLILALAATIAVASGGLPGIVGITDEDRAELANITPASPLPQDPFVAADAAKPRASGQIGPFVATADEWPDWPTCDVTPGSGATNPSESPLYFGMPVDPERTGVCPNGAIQTMLSADNRGEAIRRYFVGEAKVNFPFAAAERVKLTTVSGFPAIAAEPLSGVPWSKGTVGPAALVVLERPPSDTQPGILLVIDGEDVAKMISLSEEIISKSSR